MQIQEFYPFAKHYQETCSQVKPSFTDSKVVACNFFSFLAFHPEASTD